MKTVFDLVVVAHLLGMAAIVGAFFVVLRRPRFVDALLWGAIAQVVTGFTLAGIQEADVLDDVAAPNHAKIGVKLSVALVVLVLAWLQRKNRESAPTAAVHTIGGLAILNVLIAELW